MHEWDNFYVAVAGASAALTGLIFVGISINLKKILAISTLTSQASVSLILLLSILVFSILLLVPQKVQTFTGCEITVLGFIVWVIVTRVDLKIYQNTLMKYKRVYLFNLFFDQLATLPYIIAGLCLLLVGDVGLYWTVPAITISFIKAVYDAWVLLIEIKR